MSKEKKTFETIYEETRSTLDKDVGYKEPSNTVLAIDTSNTTVRQRKPDDICRTKEEVLKLLMETFTWLNGLGEYPDKLTEILDEDILGEVEDMDEDSLYCLPERVLVRVLLWVAKMDDLQ